MKQKGGELSFDSKSVSSLIFLDFDLLSATFARKMFSVTKIRPRKKRTLFCYHVIWRMKAMQLFP